MGLHYDRLIGNYDQYEIVEPQDPSCIECGIERDLENTRMRTHKKTMKMYYQSRCIICNNVRLERYKKEQRAKGSEFEESRIQASMKWVQENKEMDLATKKRWRDTPNGAESIKQSKLKQKNKR